MGKAIGLGWHLVSGFGNISGLSIIIGVFYECLWCVLPGYCRRVARCGMDLIKEDIDDFGKALRISFVVLIIEFSIKFLFGVFPSV